MENESFHIQLSCMLSVHRVGDCGGAGPGDFSIDCKHFLSTSLGACFLKKKFQGPVMWG